LNDEIKKTKKLTEENTQLTKIAQSLDVKLKESVTQNSRLLKDVKKLDTGVD